MQIDASRFATSSWVFHQIWALPLMMALCLVLLFRSIGAAAFSGFGLMALLVPIYMVGVHFFQKWDTEIQEVMCPSGHDRMCAFGMM
jgi:hypothetical protein